MFKDYKFKTELHTHSSPASICSDVPPEQIVEIYKSHGYDSIVLTNHFTHYGTYGEDCENYFNTFLDDYRRCREFGEKAGLNVIFGAEIRFSENSNDYLIYGICPDDMDKIKSLLPYGIDNFYREFKNDKNIIFQAHPFRDKMERANPESLDGIEVFNMHPNHNSRVAIAANYARENGLIATCGTDFHHIGQECLSAIYTKEKIIDSYQLAQIIKSCDFIMEAGGYTLLPETSYRNEDKQ